MPEDHCNTHPEGISSGTYEFHGRRLPGSHRGGGGSERLTDAGFDMKALGVVGKGIIPTKKSLASTTPAIESNFGARAAPFGAASGACSSAACS
jgi:hypothetical protein